MKTKFTLILFLGWTFLKAQSFYNINSNVFISSGTTFTVGDSLVNNGTLTNNGNMVMGGVWINTGTYNPGTGEITFNNPPGGKSQIINHNNQSFNKLTINGGGEKLILADMTIVGELNLVSGVIANENNSKVVFQPGAKITGGSDQSHINAPVEQQGSGSWLFPMGNGSTYLPVEISGVTDNTARGVIQAHELSSGEVLTGERSVTQLSSKRYWELSSLGGSLANTTITLPLRNESTFTGAPELFAVVESSAAFGPYKSLGQSAFTGDASNGRISSESSPTLSFFTVATVSGEKNVIAYNGVSPNGDGYNDYFQIFNIQLFPNNKVTVFNRWGDKVFELDGYDNDQRIFTGENNVNQTGKLPSGIYFYKIQLGDGSKELTGYLELKNEPR
ncbi:MAG TPA: hypothetical protein DIW27_10165 [Cytophagales bacterium]|nr:hypothetical protein [Cytophagales bacterium]